MAVPLDLGGMAAEDACSDGTTLCWWNWSSRRGSGRYVGWERLSSSTDAGHIDAPADSESDRWNEWTQSSNEVSLSLSSYKEFTSWSLGQWPCLDDRSPVWFDWILNRIKVEKAWRMHWKRLVPLQQRDQWPRRRVVSFDWELSVDRTLFMTSDSFCALRLLCWVLQMVHSFKWVDWIFQNMRKTRQSLDPSSNTSSIMPAMFEQ